MKERVLDAYARLVVRMGVNLQKGQPVVINTPVECADFARRLARFAYEAGARDVTMCWNDEKFARLRYELAPEEALGTFPDWRRRLYDDNAAADAAIISIHAEDPEAFRGIEPARLAMAQQAAGTALKSYRARIMRSQNAWCVVSVPTVGWARRVFSGQTDAEAVESLWTAILAAVRVTEDDGAEARWEAHTDFLRRAADFMNGWAFSSLHYKNALGTDFVVRLPEGHLWAGGAELTTGGTRFVANLPTEEVFTLPMRDGAEGVVCATRPLVFQGNLIKDMRLTFRAGRVVDYAASEGRGHLEKLLETDEGSARLGEVALVPYDSPISRSGLLFYNTLFDENASCHLALGKAYPTSLSGGAAMSQEELLARGVNDSLLHEDFMIGSRDLSITGTTKDGREVPVFRDGNFVEF